MGKALSDDAIARYHQEGYHFPVRAMGGDEALAYRRRLEDWESRNPTGMPPVKLLRSKAHLLSTALCEIVFKDTILDAVEDVLGPNILCWASGVFAKNPNDKSFIAWHQDGMYWGLDRPDIVTAWVALTDSTIENGAMRVIPGSQHEMLPHADVGAEGNLLARGQEIAVEVDENAAVDLVLKAGEFSLHHVKLAHGSEPNVSNDRRIGFAIRYIAPHVKQLSGAEDSAMLVRGHDSCGHFGRDVPPESDFEQRALDILFRAHERNQRDRGALANPAG